MNHNNSKNNWIFNPPLHPSREGICSRFDKNSTNNFDESYNISDAPSCMKNYILSTLDRSPPWRG